MSKNTANMLVETNDPNLARVDIKDMFSDLGYGTSGDITAVTTTGEANKLVKVNSSGRVILGGVDDGINKLQITGNTKITGLAGTGTRMVVADATGNLSTLPRLSVINFTGLTTSYQLTLMPTVNALSYIWKFTSSTGVAILESTHNLYIGNDVYSQFLGATVTEITPNTNYSFRLGDSVVEIGISASSGEVYLKRNSGTVTDLTIERIIQNI